MLSYFNVYKNLERNGSQHAGVAYTAYQVYKKQYKNKLNLARRLHNENYIEQASNKCKAAWEVISAENKC